MNALNETVVNQLGDALDKANSDDSVRTIVLDGAGKAFVAGADVKFFVDKTKQIPSQIFTISQQTVMLFKTNLNHQARPQLH